MPRKPRNIADGRIYHVCNRATESRLLFQTRSDYLCWIQTLLEALEKYPLKIYAFCLMPNHWHLLASGRDRKTFVRGMQWIGATHAIRWRFHHDSVGKGAVYQSRYRSHWVKPNQVFWIVTRYIERNPVRANLVDSCEKWEWSSLGQKNGHSVPLEDPPWPRPQNWSQLLEAGGSELEEKMVRESLLRGKPLEI